MFVRELTYGKVYTAIEHIEKGNFTVLQLLKKKKELQVLKKENFGNFEQVIASLKGVQHLFLVLNDEQVLSKKVATSNTDEKIILRTAFPNIVIQDFYYEIYKDASGSFVSIARKSNVDAIISSYQKAKIFVIDFSLGNLVIKSVIPFVETKQLLSSNAQIIFEDQAIVDIQKREVKEERYILNNLEISNSEVLSLAGIISYYTNNGVSVLHKQLKETFVHKRFFDVGLKAGLGFLLLLLMVNFFFYSSYRDQVGEMLGELQISQTYKNQLNALQEEINQKKRLVESVESASNTKLSKYIDELGSTTPQSILLSQIHYQPIEGVQKKEKPIAFQKKQIVVKGGSKENEDFSKWISQLEQKQWIDKITIHQYGKGKKRSSIAIFEFVIQIHDR
jgi:Tfp pilus assembly protein PilN